MRPSSTHLVLIPSYNSGPRLAATVEEVLRHWSPVWVVIDGSTDRSGEPVRALAGIDRNLRVIERGQNGGKGSAIAHGVDAALQAGFTHVLTMDSDGQHPADHIAAFMRASADRPEALVLGRPVFGSEAPAVRRHGRKLSIALAWLEILGAGIDDPLFGFRVYPAGPLRSALASTRYARGFDFDHEIAVRLVWSGIPTLNLPAPCRYLSKQEGGVSHFRYRRDNLLLVWLHLRLISKLAAGRWIKVCRLRRLGLVALVLAASGGVRAAAPPFRPSAVIADPRHDPAWSSLFRRLARKTNREADFVERRYYPFRKAPVVFTGVLRMAVDRGLSLDYVTPARRILIVDRQGLLIRDGHGRDLAAPSGGRAGAIAGILIEVIRFDLRRVQRDFELRGSRQGPAWSLALAPRSPRIAAEFRTIAITGKGSQLDRIELIKSASQRIDIAISRTRDGVAFPTRTLSRYFR